VFFRRRPRSEPPSSPGGLLDGYRASSVIVAAAQLGVFERLAHGPSPVEELAASLKAHAASLHRLLRALASLDLVSTGSGRWSLTPSGRAYVPGASEKHDLAIVTGAEYLPAWAHLAHSIATGEPAFSRVFGTSVWEHRAKHPALDAHFQAFLSRIEARIPEAILRAFDLSGRGLVVDVGGGRGGVLAALLERHPDVRGIVFEQPQVVANGLGARAVALGDRIRAVGGSFFDSVPAGGDVYLLARVLHDWDDESACAILRRVRAAMAHGAVLLIAEALIDHESVLPVALAMRDLHMLAVLGGKERTLEEYAALLASAGLHIVRVTRDPERTDVLEARATTE
jgi:hypothetical protein